MTFRTPIDSDLKWMIEAYDGWMTSTKVESHLRYWMNRTNGGICRVMDDANGPVGLIVYRRWFIGVQVTNLLVRPHLRRMGWGTEIWKELRRELLADGVVVARFKTLPGPIRDQLGTTFKDIDGMVGELTWDMEI